MKKIEKIPDAELDVMLTLWHSPEPLNVGQITAILSDTRSWKTPTVHVLLDRLEARGFVSCDKSNYKHLFTPTVAEEDYRNFDEKTHMRRFFGGSAKNMIAALLDTDGLSDDDINELSALIERKKGEK